MRSGLWTIFASSKGAHVETFLQLTLDCFLPLRGKRNPSTILYRQRMRSQRASKHYQALVERQLDAAVENSLPGPVTPQPLTALLPAAESESPPTADPPAPAPPPRPPPNRLLVFDAPANLPAAAAVEPAREPSPQEPAAVPSSPAPCLATAASPAREEPPPQLLSNDDSYDSASPPDSPEIHCSQYRLAQHEENKTAVLHDKVNDWRQRCASPEVTAAPDRYPTPPGAPDDDVLSSYTDSLCDGGRRYTANYKGPEPSTRLTSKHLLVRHRDRVWVRKDHRDSRGLAPTLLRRNRPSRPTGP